MPLKAKKVATKVIIKKVIKVKEVVKALLAFIANKK
jgi:hypothetical protein